MANFIFYYGAFAAYEENCLVDIELEHRERLLLVEYKKKFEILSLEDPMSVKHGWLNEENGLRFWPKLYFVDIFRYY